MTQAEVAVPCTREPGVLNLQASCPTCGKKFGLTTRDSHYLKTGDEQFYTDQHHRRIHLAGRPPEKAHKWTGVTVHDDCGTRMRFTFEGRSTHYVEIPCDSDPLQTVQPHGPCSVCNT